MTRASPDPALQDAPAEASWVRWKVTGFLAVASAINYADRTAFSAVLVPLQKELGLTTPQLGLLSALFLWSYGLGSPFAGNLADRTSRTRIVIGSLFLWSLFSALTGWAGGLLVLVILRLALGLSECAYAPAAFGLLGDHYPPKIQARVMSFFSVGSRVGIIGGGTVAGYLAQRFGWRSGFWVLGSAGIALAFVAPYFISDGPRAREAATGPKAKSADAFRYLLGVPSYQILLLRQILGESSTWILLTWLPFYLTETFHLKLGMAGFAGTSLSNGLMMFGLLAGGWISDRVSATRRQRRMLLLALGYLAAAPFPLAFLGTPTLALVATTTAISSLLIGLGSVNERPIVSDVVPPCFRSTAYGVMNTFSTTAGGVGVFVAGLLKQHFGLSAVFAGSTVLYLLSAVTLLIAWRYTMPRDLARARDYGAA